MTSITAHRGARGLWPENSLLGFREAAKLPVAAIEFDVHLTEAGELIVIHDATLQRTVEAEGPVRTLTPERRRAVRLRGTDEAPPLIDEVLAVLAPVERLALHVEIKHDEAGRRYAGIEALVAARLAQFGVAPRVHLTSFDTAVLAECRRVAPEIARLVSVNADWAARRGGLAGFLDAVEGLVGIVAVEQNLLEREWKTATARLGRERLCVWTVNDEAALARWFASDVGHLTTDRPDLALAAQARLPVS